jgi:hypothetical protein
MGGADITEQGYEAGNNVESELFDRGDMVRARAAAGGDLATAADANIADGDPVNFADGGTVKVAESRASAVAVAREDNDNSGGAGDNLVLVQVV